MSKLKATTKATGEAVLPASSGSDTAVNTVSAPKYGYGGIDMMALLAATMDKYKDIPDNEMRAGLQWFFSKYGKGI